MSLLSRTFAEQDKGKLTGKGTLIMMRRPLAHLVYHIPVICFPWRLFVMVWRPSSDRREILTDSNFFWRSTAFQTMMPLMMQNSCSNCMGTIGWGVFLLTCLSKTAPSTRHAPTMDRPSHHHYTKSAIKRTAPCFVKVIEEGVEMVST